MTIQRRKLYQSCSIVFMLLLFTGCSAKAKTTVLPTPTSVIPSLIPALQLVVNGQGVPEAAAYRANEPGPHRLVILTTSGGAYLNWNDSDPYGWLPTSISDTELVVLIGQEREIEWGKQEYLGGPDITAFVFEVDLELREARTGKTLTTTTYKGSAPPPFPYEAPVEQIRLEGSHLSQAGLETWLCPHVIPKGCWTEVKSFKSLQKDSDTALTLEFSPDGQKLAYGTFEGGVGVWRSTDGARLVSMEGHKGIIRDVAFSPDGEILASLTLEEGVFFSRVSDGSFMHALVETADETDSMISLAFSPDGQTLATGSMNDDVQLWHVADGAQLVKPKGHESVGSGVAFSPDGSTLAAGAGSSYDHSIILWQVSDGKKLRTFETGQYGVESVAFSPDGALLASGSVEGIVQLWQLSDGSLLRTLKASAAPVIKLAFTPDGQTLLAVSEDDCLRMWKVSDGSLLRSLEIINAAEIAISTDGKNVAASNWDGIHLWQIQ